MIIVYTDGASSGNPGESGAGIYIKADGKIYEYAIPLGIMSNHEAEFHAVIHALDICKKLFAQEILSFRTDSKIAVDTIEKNFTKNKSFQPLLQQINIKSQDFPYFFIKWIPANTNSHADELARQAIHRQ